MAAAESSAIVRAGAPVAEPRPGENAPATDSPARVCGGPATGPASGPATGDATPGADPVW
jgi:hypothetical protein